jgi:hypothetical protein
MMQVFIWTPASFNLKVLCDIFIKAMKLKKAI